MWRIRGGRKKAQEPKGTDTLNVGKRSGMQRQWIYKHEPDYVAWAVEEVTTQGPEDGGCHWELGRFVAWALKEKDGAPKAKPSTRKPSPPRQTTNVVKAEPGSSSGWRRRRESETDVKVDQEATESERSDRMIVQALSTIMSRMDRLETMVKKDAEKEDTSDGESSWSLRPEMATTAGAQAAAAGGTASSIISEEVMRLGGTACRLGMWNGYNLCQRAGFQRAQDSLCESRPQRVWFSPPMRRVVNNAECNSERSRAEAEIGRETTVKHEADTSMRTTGQSSTPAGGDGALGVAALLYGMAAGDHAEAPSRFRSKQGIRRRVRARSQELEGQSGLEKVDHHDNQQQGLRAHDSALHRRPRP